MAEHKYIFRVISLQTLRPACQRPVCTRLHAFLVCVSHVASSTMVSLRAQNLFLLRNNALQFDFSVIKRPRKRIVFKSRYHKLRESNTLRFESLLNVSFKCFSLRRYLASYRRFDCWFMFYFTTMAIILQRVCVKSFRTIFVGTKTPPPSTR
jgi:hypothetical protein